MTYPKISIITVTYNSASTLQKTIDSYMSQTYQNKELIIIDGKSKDETVSIIEKNIESVNYWISEKDTGIPDALNKGLRASTGDWVYFLNSDDVFYDENVLLNIFGTQIHEADLLYGDVILKSSGNRYDGEFTINKLFSRNICHQAQFFNKRTIETIGFYNERYRYISDYDYTLRIFADSNSVTKYIDSVIAIFDDSGRTSVNIDTIFWQDRKAIFLKRFYPLYRKKEIVEAYKPFFYYTMKNGSIVFALGLIIEMYSNSFELKWLKDGLKLLKDRIVKQNG